MPLTPAKLLESLSKRGLAGTAKYSITAATDALLWHLDSWYDRVHHVDTSGKIAMADVKVASANAALATWYEPAPNSCFRQLIQQLPIDFSDYVFIDYGSGKGRVLFMAAEHPFSRVIGVEFAPELHEVALRNIQTYRSRNQRCHAIESVCMDAVDFELPPQPAVLFFYSPFNATILSRILDRVEASLREHPRSLYLLYLGVLADPIALLMNRGLKCKEVKLRRDYLRGVTKRGFIGHSGVPTPRPSR